MINPYGSARLVCNNTNGQEEEKEEEEQEEQEEHLDESWKWKRKRSVKNWYVNTRVSGKDTRRIVNRAITAIIVADDRQMKTACVLLVALVYRAILVPREPHESIGFFQISYDYFVSIFFFFFILYFVASRSRTVRNRSAVLLSL